MRIISDFKDYYDCIQAYGQDDLLYLRRKSVVEFIGYGYPFVKFLGGWEWNYRLPRFSALTIGFCGKIYRALVAVEGKREICHSIEDVESIIGRQPKRVRELYGVSIYRRARQSRKTNADAIRKFFNPEPRPDYYAPHFEKAPIFVGEESPRAWDDITPRITYNACLRQFEFMRVLEPYTAFQELFMYLSNQAKPFKPIPEVSDADMLVAKGFDKHSFRKQKAT